MKIAFTNTDANFYTMYDQINLMAVKSFVSVEFIQKSFPFLTFLIGLKKPSEYCKTNNSCCRFNYSLELGGGAIIIVYIGHILLDFEH